MVTVAMKNCNINVISFDLVEIKICCYLWIRNQELKLQKSQCEEEAIYVFGYKLKLQSLESVLYTTLLESDSGVEPLCQVHYNATESALTNRVSDKV
jgi:hypothetical protein